MSAIRIVKALSPLLLVIGSVLGALLIALLIVIPALEPTAKDIQQLFLFMFCTGVLTLGTAYLLYRGRIMQRFNSLRWALLSTVIFAVVLVFLNVWVTAQLMFINFHDLVLTTALLVFAGLIAVVSVFFVSSALIERIHALAKATDKLARGDLQTRLAVKGNDELAQLARTFNMMAETLQTVDEQKHQLEQTRRDLVAWVSHDLRTPLAAIRAMNEALLDGVVTDPQTRTRYTENIQKEVQHLSRLIDDLFELSQLDTGRIQMTREMTSLHDLISDTLGSMGVQAAQCGVTLSGKVEDPIDMLYVAPDKIQRVLYNLLDNAIRHTPPGGEITLLAEQVSGQVQISVHNSGSTIAAEDLPRIFDSFYRSERSRAQTYNGYRGAGLGLAIARGFVEAHGGRIWVESQADMGTTFVFTLPLT